jgi:tetratricopeptide (TPR) repeat protein
MEVLAREEANVCTAVPRAVVSDQFDVAVRMNETFRVYLEHLGRLRERDHWSAWLADAAAHTTFSEAVALAEINRAWSLFTQGHADEAVLMLDALIERLQQTTAFDATFQLAVTQTQLGRIYEHASHAERAWPILTEAARAWERLVGQIANLSPSETIEHLLTSEMQEAKQRREACAEQLNNLSATLGDLANALRSTVHLDKALSTAEHGIDIQRVLGRDRNIAAGLMRTAQIFMEQGHYQAADARCDQALEADRRLGDQGLEGLTLQNQGRLAYIVQQYDRAVDLYQQALTRFQDANDDAGIMRTCNLLGAVEDSQGRLSEAMAWYERSHEIARHRSDTRALGIVAQNIGIVCQKQGEAARQHGDEATAQQRFAEAERYLRESLRMKIDQQNKPGEASSRSQLSQVYLLLGKLDTAEAHAHQAREIDEGLGLIRGLPIDYYNLAQIARARGDEAQAAQWEAKRNEVEAELARCARGGDAADVGLP